MLDLEDMAAIAQRAAEVADQYDPEFQGFVSHIALTRGMVSQAPDDWYYRNYYDLALRESGGPKMAPLELPPDFAVMEANSCFLNCWKLAMDNPDLTYCEGYAYWQSLPLEHAWIETPNGDIVDPTWSGIPDAYGHDAIYMGVRFSTEFVMSNSIRTGWSSIFGGDHTNEGDHQILKRGLKMHNGLAIDLNEVST